MSRRKSEIKRTTKETDIELVLNLDGTGEVEVDTGIPFFDHMLAMVGKHGLMDLKVKAKGDLEVDGHHTVEDIGICLGQALNEAVGEKKGIRRYGSCIMPMDEALALVALDISGRPYLVYDVELPAEIIGSYDTLLTVEFLQAFANTAAITLHVKMLSGRNAHHMVEAVFKGLARALGEAVEIDPRNAGQIPSTKGRI
ncbi:MAG: imidazoleglycerol-phosphate dehydratase HisB [Actinomycetota bacterium]|uniref:Imidazoleglycerol-phosphate dehydratase n=1 Tax=Candidatus Aquicultor primus TaxID=1797195 RepID=A0A1F2UPX9_9ACTN|nr:imidazoleglycerol-phosphate dehydratase HisB [Actinomycetota bacterium]OFW33125.1 MAG: imidazoleglycerol-phosphate dehydratase [Candidatus Aquicultor primus]HCH00090.1 imidazoleglycerol-phosphate dehydratase HisB [Actinomycetota bacterium]